MTMTLRVKDALRGDPSMWVSGGRLVVQGVLLVTGDDIRIFEADEGGPDEQLFLQIDDPPSAALIRDSLPQPPPDGWWYFGMGVVDGLTRRDTGRRVIREVMTVWLDEVGGERPLRIVCRPSPWWR